jgi:hypothetical protein
MELLSPLIWKERFSQLLPWAASPHLNDWTQRQRHRSFLFRSIMVVPRGSVKMRLEKRADKNGNSRRYFRAACGAAKCDRKFTFPKLDLIVNLFIWGNVEGEILYRDRNFRPSRVLIWKSWLIQIGMENTILERASRSPCGAREGVENCKFSIAHQNHQVFRSKGPEFICLSQMNCDLELSYH